MLLEIQNNFACLHTQTLLIWLLDKKFTACRSIFHLPLFFFVKSECNEVEKEERNIFIFSLFIEEFLEDPLYKEGILLHSHVSGGPGLYLVVVATRPGLTLSTRQTRVGEPGTVPGLQSVLGRELCWQHQCAVVPPTTRSYLHRLGTER